MRRRVKKQKRGSKTAILTIIVLFMIVGATSLGVYARHVTRINEEKQKEELQAEIEKQKELEENLKETSNLKVSTPDTKENKKEEPVQTQDQPEKEEKAQAKTEKVEKTEKTQKEDSEKQAEKEKEEKKDEDKDTKGEFSFQNTLFIGDSRTEGLLINTGLTDATFYATRGLAVDNIYEKKFVGSGKNKQTVLDALKNGTQYDRIYLMFGVNELGWVYDDVFIEKYAGLIKDIKERQPDTKIVVQSILPVTKQKSDGDKIYNNKNIYRYNELIEKMAEDEEITYVDLTSVVADKNGALAEEGAVDGVHLTKSYYQKWLDYLTDNEI